MALNIVIACGGTGGHLFPGIAVAQALQTRGHDVLVLISEKNIDALASEGHDQLRFEKIPAMAMPPVFSLRMGKFAWRCWRTTVACKKLLRGFGADAVLGMGGFTSLPPLYAGRKLKLPTLLHESNAIPGKSNLLSARFCDLVLLGLGECASHFPRATTNVVGTPLRETLRAPVDRAEAAKFFDMDTNCPVLLVMGGSQGARGVNETVLSVIPQLDPQTLQIIHLTGPQEFNSVQAAYGAFPHRSHVAPFCQRMEFAYALATICISRAGASSLTELSAFGLPSILIPYPHAAEDHQTKNAEVFTRAHAALMVQERDLSSGRLLNLINNLLTHEEARRSLQQNMRNLSPANSAELVCTAIESLCAESRFRRK